MHISYQSPNGNRASHRYSRYSRNYDICSNCYQYFLFSGIPACCRCAEMADIRGTAPNNYLADGFHIHGKRKWDITFLDRIICKLYAFGSALAWDQIFWPAWNRHGIFWNVLTLRVFNLFSCPDML